MPRQVLQTRQNLLLYSQLFGTAPATTFWTGDTNGGILPVVTDNFALAPDGTMTAARLQLDEGSGSFARIQQAAGASDPTATYTQSLWMKQTSGVGSSIMGLRLGGAAAGFTVTGTWQRFSFTTPFSVSTAAQIIVFTGVPTSTTADVLIWGAQLVRANWAGNYTPTTSAYVNLTSALRNTP